MTTSEDIKGKVLKANEEAHDGCALNHTRAVPYMSRKNTREYMWDLIEKTLRENGAEIKGAEVLEMACGTGTFVNLFQKLGAASYDGVDLSTEMIKIASRDHKYPNVRFYKDTLESYSAKNPGKFDIVISSSFLHHLADLETGFLELRNLLKPGGIYIGLHEVDVGRPFTLLELFDHELSCLLGYQGQAAVPRQARLKRFIKFFMPNRKLQFFANRSPFVNPNETDYIDYQLNFGFDLLNNPIARKYGKAMPYCYYSFAEFRHFKNVPNHSLFIMKNEADGTQSHSEIADKRTPKSSPIRTYDIAKTRIKIFIVTYKNKEYIDGVIKSIYASDTPPNKYPNISITIINNHSKFEIDAAFSHIPVLHNMCRPDFSTGHLARSWNQAIIHGFHSLAEPDCDILITLQDDVAVKPDFLTKLLKFHESYDFISNGCGDALCSYTPDAIRKVGLWDERFCNIGYQEADYFLRSVVYNRDRTSISDNTHGRSWQPVGKDEVLPYNNIRFESDAHEDRLDSELISIPYTNPERKAALRASINFHGVSETIFLKKWGIAPSPWTENHFKISGPMIESYIYYPYFESGICGLKDKKYVIPEALRA